MSVERRWQARDRREVACHPFRAATVTTIIAAILVIANCSSTETVTPAGPLALGTWGGDSAGLIVSDTAMHLHIGCTYGDASGRIAVDATGQIDVSGSYMLHAYPITVGPAVPARFVGHVVGLTATITAFVDDTTTHTSVVRGPVTVTLGTDPRLGPCPICRRPIITRRGG